MTDFSALEMFDIVSKHLRNRGSIDIALTSLLEVKAQYEEFSPSSENKQSVDLAIEELRSLATNYALCSQIMLEQAGKYNPSLIPKHQESFTNNIAALSYLSGILESVSTPGLLPQDHVQRVRLLVSSIIAQVIYEHFDAEKALCQNIFSKGLEKELAESREPGSIFRNGITFRLAESYLGHRHNNLGQ